MSPYERRIYAREIRWRGLLIGAARAFLLLWLSPFGTAGCAAPSPTTSTIVTTPCEAYVLGVDLSHCRWVETSPGLWHCQGARQMVQRWEYADAGQ